MAETHFTDGSIKTLTPGEWFDPRYPNLVLRVGKKARTWMYRPPRRVDGSRPGQRLGKFPDLNKDAAVRKYEAERGRIARGEPHPDYEDRILELEAELKALKRATGKLLTFGQLVENFMDEETGYTPPSGRDWAETTRSNYRQLIRDYMLPYWRDRDAESIEDFEIEERLQVLKTKAPSAANAVLRLLGTIYLWGIKKKKVRVNPTVGIDRPAEALACERVLDEAELKAVWQAFSKVGSVHSHALKMLVLTWQRRSEVAGTRWNEIAEGNWWLLPRERTKTKKRLNLIYLPPLAQDILERQRQQTGDSCYVFRGCRKEEKPVHPSYLSELTRTIRKDFVSRGVARSRFTVHDLRRTATTTCRSLGVDRRVVETILNHASNSVTDIYDLYEMKPEIQAAMTTWNDYLVDLLGLKPGAV